MWSRVVCGPLPAQPDRPLMISFLLSRKGCSATCSAPSLPPLALAALVTPPAVLAQAKVDIGDTPLIARSALFGNPVKSGAQPSPDGKWLTWMAPLNGVMNVWAAPVDQPTSAAADRLKDRPIPGYWLVRGNSEQVLFVQDKGGDENYRLYGVNVTTGAKHDYTPFDKVRKPSAARANVLDEMLVGINNRDPALARRLPAQPQERRACWSCRAMALPAS